MTVRIILGFKPEVNFRAVLFATMLIPIRLWPAIRPARLSSQRDCRRVAHGKMLFEGACVSCHGWTGESPIALRHVQRRVGGEPSSGTNVVQVVLSGTRRLTPQDAVSMPAFGGAYSDAEIAALANYVTARFGAKASRVTAHDVAELRKQTSQ